MPRWPWLGGDLQTLRNALRRPRVALASAATTRIELPMEDAGGDALLAIIDRPLASGTRCAAIVLVHGLTGCSDSTYMRASAAHFLDRGHVVVRLNLRGAWPGRRLARGHYDAGCSADLAAALDGIAVHLCDLPLVAMGFSLGGNVLLKHLGEAGDRTRLVAAIAVSAPIDLAAASRRLRAPRNALYHRYLLRRMKAEMLAAPAPVPASRREAISAARDIYEFDDRIVARDGGYHDADDYYARCSAAGFLTRVTRPTLILQAQDDPWIPADTHRDQPWSRFAPIMRLQPRHGGHVGFHGRGAAAAWHDRTAAWFLAARDLAVRAD